GLPVLDPMVGHREGWQVTAAVVVLLAITLIVVVKARTAPYLIVGWLMFLGTLVPVIGIVANGLQSVADRYTYLPSIGIFLAAVWAAGEFSVRWRYRKTVPGVVAACVVLICGVLTREQLGHWRNSYTLWARCLAVTRDNAV